MPPSKTREVMSKYTNFEYEEFEWHRYRSFSAKGDSPADVCWPEYTLEPDQRISERRGSYHAKFAIDAGGGADEYRADLDEVMWRTLKVGLKCRLKTGAFGGGLPSAVGILLLGSPCSRPADGPGGLLRRSQFSGPGPSVAK
jgi:hypothetical protein